MLRKIGLYLVLLCGLTSCFEIVEDVTFRKNGSGVLKLIINLSQSKNEINTLMKLDSNSGYRIPREKEINSYLDKAIITLKATPGLSKIVLRRDFTNWVFEIETEFNNTKSLEEGMKAIYSEFSGGKQFSFRNKLIYNDKSLEREMEPFDENVKKQLNKPTEKKIFARAKYTTIYHFENQVLTYSNKRAKLSPSKKAIMLQTNVLNLINGIESIQNNIKLN
jgi:hypothetical protein